MTKNRIWTEDIVKEEIEKAAKAQVSTLQWSKKVIRLLPKSVSELSNVTTFILDGNELTQLPKEICTLKSLQRLELRANKLTNLPDAIGTASNFQYLNIYLR
jgi:leucine-rich repeat protein SHOC2